MQKIVKYKWLVTAIFTIALVVFNLLVTNVSIINRGIAVGLAIDVEGDEVVVSAQIVLPKNGGVNAGGGNYMVVSRRSKTIKSAIDGITADLGTKLSLGHVIIVILSNDFLKADNYLNIEYFLTDEELTDNTLLVCCDGLAKNVISAKTPANENATYQLQRMMNPLKPVLGIKKASLKDFVKNHYAYNFSNVLPLVEIEKTDPSSDQSQMGIKEAEALKISKNSVINKNGVVFELNEFQSEGLSLVNGELAEGEIKIEGRNGRDVAISIIKSSTNIKYDIKTLTAKIDIGISVIRGEGIKDHLQALSYELDEVEKERFENAVKDRITDCYTACQAQNADIFGVGDGFYKRFYKEWKSVDMDMYLKDIKLDIDVKVKQN